MITALLTNFTASGVVMVKIASVVNCLALEFLEALYKNDK